MAKGIFLVNIVIVILELIVFASIVRWVDIDNINLARVGV